MKIIAMSDCLIVIDISSLISCKNTLLAYNFEE